MDKIKKLKHTVYYYGANFSCFPSFFNDITTNKKITKKLVKKEYTRLLQLSKNKRMQLINSKYDKEEQFILQYEIIIKSLKQLFHIDDYPKLFIVKKFPDIFSEKEWDSMSIDKDDEKHFGIPRGIYYKKQYLTHGYFEFIIAHEVIHWVISAYSKKYFPYVPIIEEGVCDFIGTYILLKNKILESNVIENLIIYNRALKDSGTLWEQYWKNYLSLSNICYSNGIEYIINSIKQGREDIALLANNTPENTLHQDIHHDINTRTIINILLRANAITIIGMDEYLLLEYIDENYKQKVIDLNSLDIDFNNNELLLLFKKIEALGYIHSYENNCFYNPNSNLLNSVKYSL